MCRCDDIVRCLAWCVFVGDGYGLKIGSETSYIRVASDQMFEPVHIDKNCDPNDGITQLEVGCLVLSTNGSILVVYSNVNASTLT